MGNRSIDPGFGQECTLVEDFEGNSESYSGFYRRFFLKEFDENRKNSILDSIDDEFFLEWSESCIA